MSLKRRRGLILSHRGWERLQEAERQTLKERQYNPYTLQELSELTGLSQNTLTRVRGRKIAVDRYTLEQYLQAFGLTLDPTDYTHSLSGPANHPTIPLMGQVPLNSDFYVYRSPLEEQISEALTYPGAFLQIKAPQQFGKTSLVVKVLDQARLQGLTTAILSLRLVDATVFSSQRFYQWLCAVVTDRLGLPQRVEKVWNPQMSASYNCTHYFENYLLSEVDNPLILAIDDLDVLQRHPDMATQFFCLLRAWYELANYGDERSRLWKKLRTIVCSAESYLQLHDLQAPLEASLTFQLPRFTQEQVQDLAQRYGHESPPDAARALMAFVGGHPQLVQWSLHSIQAQALQLPSLAQAVGSSYPQGVAHDGIFASHVRRQLASLQPHTDLLEAMRRVVLSETPVTLDAIVALKLEDKGLITLKGQQAVPSCALYRHYFAQVLTVKAPCRFAIA
ncbi:AAA-like domain-containing protein [Phormidesmis sp. 146-35]